jgi:hypothetical protein
MSLDLQAPLEGREQAYGTVPERDANFTTLSQVF